MCSPSFQRMQIADVCLPFISYLIDDHEEDNEGIPYWWVTVNVLPKFTEVTPTPTPRVTWKI